MASTTYITAIESFAFVGPAGAVNIRKGETFHKDAARLAHCPPEALEKNFEPFSPNHDIETATAAPGERRKGRPRRNKSESEKDDGVAASDGPDGSTDTETKE